MAPHHITSQCSCAPVGSHLSAQQSRVSWDLSIIILHLTQFNSILFCSSKFSGLVSLRWCSLYCWFSSNAPFCSFPVHLSYPFSTWGHWPQLFLLYGSNWLLIVIIMLIHLYLGDHVESEFLLLCLFWCIFFHSIQHIHWPSSMNSLWWWDR